MALFTLLGVSAAIAEFAPVLHEHFEPNPDEDVELGVRVTASGLPAAIKVSTGPVPLPSPTRPIERNEPSYGERQTAEKPFRIDRETTDPGHLSYHEPFRPSIAPYKRTHVFDSVNAEFDLTVSDARLRPVTMGGAPTAPIDQFFGDMAVDVAPGELIRVASVGPRMAVYSAHVEPESPFGFYVDRAENWFVRVPEGRGRLRLVMHVGVPRAVFQGGIEAWSFSALAAELPTIPANVEHAASQLLARLGISRVQGPAEALGHLVAHFRGFAESSDRPEAGQGEPLYRELVLSRKGVCRHRAYAFVVTALGLGIPARFVHNEAHAWVEVFGGTYWHRIDLGGAASEIEYRGDPPYGNPHRAPPESFPWPKQAQPGQRALTPVAPGSSNAARSGAGGPSQSSTPTSTPRSGLSVEPVSAPDQASVAQQETGKARGRLVVALSTPSDILRGAEIGVQGHIEASSGSCASVRIDVGLNRKSQRFPLGSLAADRDGRFAGKLAVPVELPVGKYDLTVSTPGSKNCAPASSE